MITVEVFQQRILKLFPETNIYAIHACFSWLALYYQQYHPLDPRLVNPHHLVVEIINDYNKANEERRKEIRGTLRGSDS